MKILTVCDKRTATIDVADYQGHPWVCEHVCRLTADYFKVYCRKRNATRRFQECYNFLTISEIKPREQGYYSGDDLHACGPNN